MNVETRDGKSQWYKSTEAAANWKQIAIVAANSENFIDLIEDRITTYGFGSLINISMSGTGAADVNPRTISDVDVWSADLKDPTNLLLQGHIVTLKQVQAYLAWIYGDKNSTLVKSADMIIKQVGEQVQPM